MKLDRKLQRGLSALAIELDVDTRRKLLQFLELLARWNKAYNLTAVRDIDEMLPRHLLDSLSVLSYLRGSRVVDVGTGAGLPGIPLALARPEIEFVLLDRNNKKIRFVTQAIHDLRIANAVAVHSTAEDYRPPNRFDTLIARAVAAIPDMLKSCRHLCAPGSRVLAMKGVLPYEELTAVDDSFRVSETVRLTVPGLDAERHVVILEPVEDGPQS